MTSAIGGGLAGFASCLLVLQYDVHPFIGNSFGPITFMICVLGGLGNMIGGFVAAFIISQIISIGGLLLLDRVFVRPGVSLVHCHDLCAAARTVQPMNPARLAGATALVLMALLPLVASQYMLHIAIQILIWGFVYTAWSMMGRFGLTSFGHGAFLGVGAYLPALLWNFYGVTPWLGIPAAMLLAILLALVIGYPSFRLRVVGHYFALVTLALSQVVLLSLIAARDVTGGSLGMTLKTVGHSWYALQFTQKSYFYIVALVVWIGGLAVWQWIDHSISRVALEAISEDETAAAAGGIDVMREKLGVTVISAALTALGGSVLTQYIQYVNPETVSGVAVSLQIVFAAIAGGMHVLLGPTVGALFTIALNEGLRVAFGIHFIGAANTIYGILLILFIIFMPRGIVGLIEEVLARTRGRPRAAADLPVTRA